MRFQSRDLVLDVFAKGLDAAPAAWAGPIPDCRACSATPARPDDPGCPPPTRRPPNPGPQRPQRCEKATAKNPPKKRVVSSLDLLRSQLRTALRASG